MSRRYVYPRRLSKLELQEALRRHDLSPHQLAKVSGASENNVHKWLQGEQSPVYITRDFDIWNEYPEVLSLMLEWAHDHAVDNRGPSQRN